VSERGGAEPGREASLAEQAAAWIPPWERARPPEPDPGPEPAPTDAAEDMTSAEDETPPADQAVGEAEDETVPADQAVGGAEDVPVSEEQDPVAAAELAEAPPDAVVGDLARDADHGTEGAATGGSAVEDAGPAPSRVSDGEEQPPAAETIALIDEGELRGALEAIMLVVDEPVQEVVLAQVLEQPTERVAAALEEIAAGYTAAGHGFELRRAAGGWRLYTRPEYAAYVERFVLDGQSVRLTQAALETLAVIAYKQPVTRARISAIRGVNCDGVVRTLTSRGLVEEAGTEPETGAYLYRTTALFLEKLGLDSVDQLPDLAPFLPDDVDEVADGER
jgi:segregation and condensation protein B